MTNSLNFKNGYYLILGCAHFPYHNVDMFDLFLEVQSDIQPVKTILNGDAIDLASLSGHQKGQKVFCTLEEEIDQTNRLLSQIKGEVEYTYGNHEMRYAKFFQDVETSKLGAKSLANELRLKYRGWKVQDDWKTAKVQVGEFSIIHGLYCGQNPAKKHVTNMNESVIFNHTHCIDHYYENKFSGHNLGWGGNSKLRAFNYVADSQKAQWRNGFGVIYLDNGTAHFQQIEFKNGKFFFNGKLYSVK